MDMPYCMQRLESIRVDEGDAKFSHFSDFYKAGYVKTSPWAPRPFVSEKLQKGSNPLYVDFYDEGQDPLSPPHFVSLQSF